MTKLFWISGPWKGRLAITARPRGGDWLVDELSGWREAGVTHVVSLLTGSENDDLELSGESSACHASGLGFSSFPIEDREIPGISADTSGLVSSLDSELSRGASVVIHCRQGVGRAGMMAAALLIARGFDPAAAIAEISAARGVTIPETEGQRFWLLQRAAAGPVVPAHL